MCVHFVVMLHNFHMLYIHISFYMYKIVCALFFNGLIAEKIEKNNIQNWLEHGTRKHVN